MRQELFLNSTGRQELSLNSTGRQELFLNLTGRQEFFLNSTGRHYHFYNRHATWGPSPPPPLPLLVLGLRASFSPQKPTLFSVSLRGAGARQEARERVAGREEGPRKKAYMCKTLMEYLSRLFVCIMRAR